MSSATTHPHPRYSARAAGLRYVTDDVPGIRRVKKGNGFSFRSPSGRPVNAATRKRIASLVIPPAWTDVWICPDPRGHLQATGRDARGRKQHRYHPDYRLARDEAKFERVIPFAKALPAIRRTTRRHLKLPGLPREKVLAAVVKLLEKTLIRVGNDEYARTNHSYGLTTLRDRHVRVNGSKVEFNFRGKSGIERAIDLNDQRLARVIAHCQDLPGQELFQYIDDQGVQHDVKSDDVNAYLAEITGGESFSSKDFRTWAGTVLAAIALRELDKYESETQARKNIVQAVEDVAGKLGNTRAVCRKCYIHPAILDSYLDGSLLELMQSRLHAHSSSPASVHGNEEVVIRILRKALRGKSDNSRVRNKRP